MITVKRYTPENHQTWNEFVKQSRQGTFLFDRNYMDYHQDRFHDHSLMIYYKDKLYALLPANEVVSASGNKVGSDSDIEISLKELVSHQGLTYGGLLTCNKMTAALTCETFEAIGNYLKQEGFRNSPIRQSLGFITRFHPRKISMPLSTQARLVSAPGKYPPPFRCRTSSDSLNREEEESERQRETSSSSDKVPPKMYLPSGTSSTTICSRNIIPAPYTATRNCSS